MQCPALSLFFGASLHLLGIGSLLFHASLSRFGQQLDVSAMYLPLLTLASISIARQYPEMIVPSWLFSTVSCSGINAENNADTSMAKSRYFARSVRYYSCPSWRVLLCVSTVIEGFLFAFKWSIDSKNLLTNMILSVFLLGLLSYLLAAYRHTAVKSSSGGRLSIQWWILSLAAVGLGRTAREMDVQHRFFGGPADDLNLLHDKGHALWHLLTAIALTCMYLFYRFEDYGSQASEFLSSSQLV